MAESLSSQRRTELIREMARDLQKSRPISISSRVSDTNSNIDNDSNTSEFNPSSTGLGSTRRMDEQSQQLPQLQASRPAQSPRPLAPTPDYKINTSAFGRAFPIFSRSGSERDDDSSRSIEFGRGHQKREENNNGPSSLAFERKSDTSKKEALSLKNVLGARRRSLEKETPRVSPPTVKATDYVSGGSRQSSMEAARPEEQEEENITQFSDERISTTNITGRSSRFGGVAHGQPPAPVDLPKNFTSSRDFLKNLSNRQNSTSASKQAQPNNATVTPAFQSTIQSHMTRDLPNCSELLSGVFEDGTPVFSRTTKARATSGSSRVPSQQGRKSRVGHYPIGGIAVPEDEEAIYLSLKLLQEKLAELEVKRSQQEAKIQSLEDRNSTLEGEKLVSKRMSSRDSGIGQTSGSDADDDFAQRSRKSVIERTRLETTIRTLQGKLDVATKKVKTSESTVVNLSAERDSALSQLGVAFVNMEQLKVDKEALEGENAALKAEIRALRTQSRMHVSETTSQESGKARSGFERAESRESVQTNGQDYTQLLNIDANSHQRAEPSNVDATTEQPLHESTKNDAPRKRKTRLVLEEYSETEHSEEEISQNVSVSQKQPESKMRDVSVENTRSIGEHTVLSTMGSGRFADLRRTLEEQRIKNRPKGHLNQNNQDIRRVVEGERTKQRPQSHFSQSVEGDSGPSRQHGHLKAASIEVKLPQKSSMKNMKERSKSNVHETLQSQKEVDVTTQPKTSVKESEANIKKNQQRRKQQRNAMENMTSAFIVPDITMRNPGEATMKLSQSAREVFDRLAQHDGQNCSICKRVIDHGIPHEHENATRLTVPKPTPVSERMPSPGPDDDEPTMRPSQPPAVALATVLKGLEDELKHLKIKLSEYQALYNCHDPALSKRKRKAVFDKIEKLLATIDIKADQIYALYDVLEGQKQSGQEMDEDEVEVTLLRIGVDPNEINMRGGHITTDAESDNTGSDSGGKQSIRAPSQKSSSKRVDPAKKNTKKVKQVWDLESDDDNELPWEGFETTGELTGRSGRSSSSKRRV